MKQKRREKSVLKICDGYPVLYLSCRYWTTSVDGVTHAADVGRCPGTPDSVAGIFIECRNKSEAENKACLALKKREYGTCYFYNGASIGNPWLFGYAVHFPRFKSEGSGFINFHSFETIQEIPAESELKFWEDSDHISYRRLATKD